MQVRDTPGSCGQVRLIGKAVRLLHHAQVRGGFGVGVWVKVRVRGEYTSSCTVYRLGVEVWGFRG